MRSKWVANMNGERMKIEERVNREVRAETILDCRCNEYGKAFRSKATLTVYQKRMHREADEHA